MSMTDTPDPEEVRRYWEEALEGMGERFAETVEGNVEAQARFVEAWLEAVGEAADEEVVAEAAEGYRRAYETWMDAAEETVERTGDAIEGEEVTIEEIRDTWLNAANASFKEIMGTGAFAAVTGRAIDGSLDARRRADELSEATLHEFGLPAKGDVVEVGERIVELERRQQAVEEKLDRVLDALEG